MSQYDPRQHGAQCDVCPLRGQRPVPMDGPPDADFVIVAEAPGYNEVEQGRPLVGASGRMLNEALARGGLPRHACRATNVLLCRPPGEGDLDAFLKDIKAQNRTRTRARTAWERENAKRTRVYERAVAKREKAIERRDTTWRKRFASAWERYEAALDRAALKRDKALARATKDHQKTYERWQKEVARLQARADKEGRVLLDPPLPPEIELPVWDTPLWRDVPDPKVPAEVVIPEPPEPPELLPCPPDTELIPTPMECCRPRLIHDVSGARFYLLLGKMALHAVTGRKGIMAEQGFPIPFADGKRLALATVHPAAIMRGLEKLRPAFGLWVAKAVRLYQQGYHYVEPEPIYVAEAVYRALTRLLAEADRRRATGEPLIDMGYDVETDGLHPVYAQLRVLSMSWGLDTVVVVPVHKITGECILDGGLWGLVRRVFAHPHIRKIAHQGAYDRASLESNDIRVCEPTGDTLLAHHLVESEVPHSLAFCASVMLDAPSWKGLGDGTHGLTVSDDLQLWLYNAYDTHNTTPLHEILLRVVVEDGLLPLYEETMAVQRIVVEMTCNGFQLDREQQSNFLTKFAEVETRCADEMYAALLAEMEAYPDRGLVFWQALLPASDLVDMGMDLGVIVKIGSSYVVQDTSEALGTSKKAAAEGIEDSPGLLTRVRKLIRATCTDDEDFLRRYFNPRRAVHMMAVLDLFQIRTPLTKSGVQRSTAEDDLIQQLPFLDDAGRRFIGRAFDATDDGAGLLGLRGAEKARSTFVENLLVGPDGRVRAIWKQYGTVTGRFACEAPNLMNIPKWLRAMYVAAAGCSLVGADYSALELWIVAIYTQALNLLRALQSSDVHRKNAELLFKLDFQATMAEKARTQCSAHAGTSGTLLRIITKDQLTPAQMDNLSSVPWGSERIRLFDKGKGDGAISVEFHPDYCPHCASLAQAACDATWTKLVQLRVQAKRFVYNANYEGSDATIWAVLLRDFPDLQLGEVSALLRAWREVNPEISRRAHQNHDLYYQRKVKYGFGWLESPIMGRRRYWSGGDFGITDAANFPIQSGGADIVNAAVIRLHEPSRALGARLVAQVHDSLIYEVPDHNARAMQELLHREMPGRYKFNGIEGEWSFPIDSKIGKHWGEV